MARQTIAVTDTWQQVATGVVEVHILKKGKGTLFLNESASNTDQLPVSPNSGKFYSQNLDVPTFARANGDGWEILLIGTI